MLVAAGGLSSAAGYQANAETGRQMETHGCAGFSAFLCLPTGDTSNEICNSDIL